MRDRDQGKLANHLPGTVGYHEFHADRICSPLAMDERDSEPVNAYFPGSKLVVPPATVVVPIYSDCYKELCRAALDYESKLLEQWSNDLRTCDKESAALFGVRLADHGVTFNILRRMKAFEELKQHIGAGLYLGSIKFDDTLGDLLLYKVKQAYGACNLLPNESIPPLCVSWGIIQAKARALIIEESWRALVRRESWPVPEGFSENFTKLLEHNVAELLRGTDQGPRMTEPDSDSFWGWYSQVETLHEIKPELDVLKRLEQVREFMRSDVKELPAALEKDLAISGNAAWLAVLKDPTPTNIAFFRNCIWKSSPEATPIALAFKEGCLNSIRISDQQALEHWRQYLAHPSIQQIQVISPNFQQAQSWYNNSQADKSAFRVEMRALALLPLSPLITYLGTDVEGVSVDEVCQILGAKMEFLETLAEYPLWRNTTREQKVYLEFTSPSAEIIEHFERLPDIYTKSENLRIYPARYQSAAIGIIAYILATPE